MGKQEDFIAQIAPYMQKYSKEFGFKICSAAIAQACLESGYGESSKAVNHCNYFGLKYRPNRLDCNNGTFEESSAEQRPDGTYYRIVTTWFNFDNMEMGAKGYYEFINIPNYAKVKTATTPYAYLTAIKEAGYASSIKYVDNVNAIVNKYNLTQYDEKEVTPVVSEYTNSPLVVHTNLGPNYNPRKNSTYNPSGKIIKITPHHMAGNLTIERCGEIFNNPNRGGSSNYGIGTDGRVGLYVEEKNRAWTSGSPSNDYLAVTIEVANDGGAPDWHVSDKALESLINLCVDICQRNGIEKLVFTGDPTGNLTYHSMFQATACPGPYLKSKFPYIEAEVNKRLGAGPGPSPQPTPTPTPEPGTYIEYTVKPGDTLNKIAAQYNTTVDAILALNPQITNPNKIYPGQVIKIPVENPQPEPEPTPQPEPQPEPVPAPSKYPEPPFLVQVLVNNLNYRATPGGTVKGQTGMGTFTIVKVQDDWGFLKSGAGWIYLANPEYVKIVNGTNPVPSNNSYKVKVTASVLNIRKGPGTNYPVVGSLNKGAIVTIVEENNGWGKLENNKGWICLSWTKKV